MLNKPVRNPTVYGGRINRIKVAAELLKIAKDLLAINLVASDKYLPDLILKYVRLENNTLEWHYDKVEKYSTLEGSYIWKITVPTRIFLEFLYYDIHDFENNPEIDNLKNPEEYINLRSMDFGGLNTGAVKKDAERRLKEWFGGSEPRIFDTDLKEWIYKKVLTDANNGDPQDLSEMKAIVNIPKMAITESQTTLQGEIYFDGYAV